MASAYKRGNRWWIHYRDAHGQRRTEASTARTKKDAMLLAADLEHQAARQRRGLEPIPPADGGGTLGELLNWWLETYAKPRTSHDRDRYTIRRHFLTDPIAALKLVDVTSGVSSGSSSARPRLTARRH
jgi:hypothetical protein